MSPVLVRQAVISGAQIAQEVSFPSVLKRQRFVWNLLSLLAAAALLICLGAGTLIAAPLATWFNRNILLGDRLWPQKSYLIVERVGPNGAVVFPRGEDWTQLVSVTPASEIVPPAVYLDFRRARGRGPLLMKKSGARQFEAAFASVLEPFEFRARGGDAVTEWVRVELVEQPAVVELALVVTPPAYARQQPEALPPGRGPYYVLKGSSLHLAATANKPLAQAELAIAGRALPLTLDDPLHFSGEISAENLVPGQYSIDLTDTLGLTSRHPTTFGLRTRVDHEPRVRVKLIGVSGMVVPQARIPYSCRISDDFGVTTANIAYRWKGDDPAAGQDSSLPLPVGQASNLPDVALDGAFELSPLNIPTASGLSFHVEAADNDDISGPNLGKSSEFLLRIVTAEELRTDLLRREKEQRQEFERLVKNEEELLTDCRALEAATNSKPNLGSEHKEQLVQYHKRQKLVGQNTAAVAERLAAIVIEVQNNRLEEPAGRMQTRLTNEIIEPLRTLADDALPQAAASLDKTRRLAPPSERDAALAQAIAQQTAAVAKMKEVLEHMVKSEGFQEAVNLLYEIQKAQTQVHEQTDKERQQRIKRILEGGPPSQPR